MQAVSYKIGINIQSESRSKGQFTPAIFRRALLRETFFAL